MESLKGICEKAPTEDINQLEVIIHEEWNKLNDLVIINIACIFLKRVGICIMLVAVSFTTNDCNHMFMSYLSQKKYFIFFKIQWRLYVTT